MMKSILSGKRKIVLMLCDFLCVVLSCIVSFYFLYAIDIIDSKTVVMLFHSSFLVLYVTVYAILCIAAMMFFNVYKIVWRYAGIRSFGNCIMGVVIATGIEMIYCQITGNDGYELYFAFSGTISAIALCAMRCVYAFNYYYIKNREIPDDVNRVLIVGAGDGGRHITSMMLTDKKKYNPVAFVDDDSDKIGRIINGLPVKGNTTEIPKLVEKLKITEILVAIPSIGNEDKKRILSICSETLCKVNILPGLTDYVNNDSLIKRIQKVKIEDILGRDVVKLDKTETKAMIKDKVCMITGGGGSIGSELVRQIAKMSPKKLIIVDIYENNAYDIQQELLRKYKDEIDLSVQIASVRDYDKIESLFKTFNPELVFHAAAHKHVPLMETNPEEAIKNNVFGTLNVAKLSKKYKSEKFVLVSTDKAVNPTNIMGATKRCCEMIVECMAQETSDTEFVAVRFGNVLGSNGSVIPLFEKQIAKGGPVTVTDPKIIRYFMTIPEAASLILLSATYAHGGEIFVLDMGEPVKILNLAENLIKLHGYRPYTDIDIEFTGLRPGEKLYEELLMDEEGLRETANNKIFIGHQIEVDKEWFYEKLEELKKAADENNKEKSEEILMEVVPTFVRK